MQPMKASPADLDKLTFPLYASIKLDGIRAVVIGGVLMSNSLKPIRNKHVQSLFGHLEGFDGELIVGDANHPNVMQNTTSGVMSANGEPQVTFHCFDLCEAGGNTLPYSARKKRLAILHADKNTENCVLLEQTLVNSLDEILELEAAALEQGYEGLMLRGVESPYKYGRSTTREGYLLKLKRFSHDEAEIIGYEPLYTNTNESKVNELGNSHRSSSKDGLVALEQLGSFLCRDLKTGIEFNVGGGFTLAQRITMWRNPDSYIGLVLRYKHFPISVKDKPRMPVFAGFRDMDDLSE